MSGDLKRVLNKFFYPSDHNFHLERGLGKTSFIYCPLFVTEVGPDIKF